MISLKELGDRHAIQDAIYRYARAVDRGDVDLFKSVFWDDAVFANGPLEGVAHAQADGLILTMQKRLVITQHNFTNILITFEDNRAHSESYAICYHQTFSTQESIEGYLGTEFARDHPIDRPYDVIIGVRYLDRWSCRDGVWKIQHRQLVPDWHQITPTSSTTGGIFSRLKLSPGRGKDDPSADLLTSLI